MKATPTPAAEYTSDEERLLALLNSDIVNLAPIIKAVYPEQPHTTASSKFSAKRLRKRYQKFLPHEIEAIRHALQQQLGPILALYQSLLPLAA